MASWYSVMPSTEVTLLTPAGKPACAAAMIGINTAMAMSTRDRRNVIFFTYSLRPTPHSLLPSHPLPTHPLPKPYFPTRCGMSFSFSLQM